MSSPFDVDLAELRARRSAKWTSVPADVLPLHVAEMDVRLAAPVTAVLQEAVQHSDTGYSGDIGDLAAAFTGFVHRRWGWEVAPDHVRTCVDVAAGVTETLRLLTGAGDAVVVMPPVYPPFWRWLEAVGARAVEVPLQDPEGGGRLDLAGIERALAAGARVVLLCHPHNPTGRLHEPAELKTLAELATQYEATVLSDEIHAPLALPDQQFRPFLSVSEQAATTGIAFHSASKAWNLAGLKCGLIVTADAGKQALLAGLPHEMPWSVGHWGMLASTAAYRYGEPWLDELLPALAANITVLSDLLEHQLPAAAFIPPQAGYLAWLNCRSLGLGPDPAAVLLQRGKVAVGSGTDFGADGAGFVRLNLACHQDVLREAIYRMAQINESA